MSYNYQLPIIDPFLLLFLLIISKVKEAGLLVVPNHFQIIGAKKINIRKCKLLQNRKVDYFL